MGAPEKGSGRPKAFPFGGAPSSGPHLGTWHHHPQETVTDTPQDSVPIQEKASAPTVAVEELLGSLVGIASARIALDEGGEVEEVHVLALPETHVEAVTQSVISALRARFDLTVEASRIFVARIQDGGSPPAPSKPGGATRAKGPATRILFPRPEPEDVGPPPWPERGSKNHDSGEGLTDTFSRRIPGETADRLESRLLFLGHRTSKRRFEGVEVAVELEWQGRKHRGAASVRDEAPHRLEVPALATLRALEAALEKRAHAERSGRDVTLTLRGVELVEALGQRHVMVSILAELGHRQTPLTGTVMVEESVELATILATLQATDRRVRAVLLNHLPGNGGPPKRSSR